MSTFIAKPQISLTPQRQSTRFPGTATLHKDGSIKFIKATIIYVSPEGRIQYADPKSKWWGFRTGEIQALLSQSYTFTCDRCRTSVCAGVVPTLEAISKATGMGIVEATAYPRCPYCFGRLSDLKVGDKVLLHHRYEFPQADRDGNMTSAGWATWFAERWDW